jgi:hypothetical protein
LFPKAKMTEAQQAERIKAWLDIPLKRGHCSGAWEASVPGHVRPAVARG